MKEIVLQLYLAYGVVKDIRSYQIPVWYLVLGGLLSMVFHQTREEFDLQALIISLIPGIIFIIYSLLKKEGLGTGDGILLCIMGLWISLKIWIVWYISLLLICIFSTILLLLKKASLKHRLPYYPFFWLAYLLYEGAGYV